MKNNPQSQHFSYPHNVAGISYRDVQWWWKQVKGQFQFPALETQRETEQQREVHWHVFLGRWVYTFHSSKNDSTFLDHLIINDKIRYFMKLRIDFSRAKSFVVAIPITLTKSKLTIFTKLQNFFIEHWFVLWVKWKCKCISCHCRPCANLNENFKRFLLISYKNQVIPTNYKKEACICYLK